PPPLACLPRPLLAMSRAQRPETLSAQGQPVIRRLRLRHHALTVHPLPHVYAVVLRASQRLPTSPLPPPTPPPESMSPNAPQRQPAGRGSAHHSRTNAVSKACRARSLVESSTGNGQSSGRTRIGSSVHPSTTASHPWRPRFPMTWFK